MTTDVVETPSLAPEPEPASGDSGRRRRGPNPFTRLRIFIGEIVNELRKVVWPGRTQLVTYVTVVLFFVTFFVLLVAGLDYVFTKGVLALFG